jgi:hypothetical protein
LRDSPNWLHVAILRMSPEQTLSRRPAVDAAKAPLIASFSSYGAAMESNHPTIGLPRPAGFEGRPIARVEAPPLQALPMCRYRVAMLVAMVQLALGAVFETSANGGGHHVAP